MEKLNNLFLNKQTYLIHIIQNRKKRIKMPTLQHLQTLRALPTPNLLLHLLQPHHNHRLILQLLKANPLPNPKHRRPSLLTLLTHLAARTTTTPHNRHLTILSALGITATSTLPPLLPPHHLISPLRDLKVVLEGGAGGAAHACRRHL